MRCMIKWFIICYVIYNYIIFASRIDIGINNLNCSCLLCRIRVNEYLLCLLLLSLHINLILLLLSSLAQIYLEKNDLVWTLSYTLISKENYFKFWRVMIHFSSFFLKKYFLFKFKIMIPLLYIFLLLYLNLIYDFIFLLFLYYVHLLF